MKNERIIVIGGLPKSKWGGECIREQDFVLGTEGISRAIPSTYWKHPFKILEYEEIKNTPSHE